MGAAGAAILFVGARPAFAFTSSDADTAVNSYLKTFVQTDGDHAFIKRDMNEGDPGFWQEIEQVEGVEDANERENGALKSQVAALLNGFANAHGTDWSYNKYNDDICWAVIAYTRGYTATGDPIFRKIAKENFDIMYARAWDPSKSTLFWTTDNTSYNSCIECPAGIASYLLSRALDDGGYLKKAKDLYAWEKAKLFNTTSGAVYDNVNTHGSVSTWASTYNQGTFVGLANFLGDTKSAGLATDYTMNHLGTLGAGGYRILPEYGTGSGNNSGFNAILLRWVSKFMKDRHLEKSYLPWLQANANAAWNVRRTSDNLSWCQWLQQTPDGLVYSWDCISSVVALQVTAPDETTSKP
jgi:predicted alpha-1,6-mannanase (GH76 family)